MPTISNLNLTMSRDSRDVVTARVDYELELTAFEVDANVMFHERVALVRQVERPDQWTLPIIGNAIPVSSPDTVAGDESDRPVALLFDSDVNAAAVGLAAAGKIERTVTRALSPVELRALLEWGQDHPYVVVSAIPIAVLGDLKLAAVRTIDLGDPEVVTTVPIDGQPVSVASSGPNGSVWVVTTEGRRFVFDREGNATSRADEQGAVVDVLCAERKFWIMYSDGNVNTYDVDTGAIRGYEASAPDPTALAFDGTMLWIVGAGGALTQLAPETGASVPGRLPIEPSAFTAATTGAGARRAFAAATDGHLYVLDENINVISEIFTGVDEPRSVAFNRDVLVLTGRSTTRFFRLDPTTWEATADNTVRVPAGGAAAGADDDLWIAFEPNRLVRYQGLTETPQAYDITAAPEKVLYSGDRVFITSRTTRTLSVVRIS